MTNLIGVCGQMQAGKDLTTKIIQTLVWLDKGNKLEEPIEEFVLINGIFTPKGWRGFINVLFESGFQNRKFADKIKEIVCLLIGCEKFQLEDNDFKNKELGEEWWYYIEMVHENGFYKRKLIPYNNCKKTYLQLIKLTPRKLLQLLGTECGREIIHPNIWINALFSDYRNKYEIFRGQFNMLVEEGFKTEKECMPNWIISDVRFLNEVNAIKSRGGILIKKLGKESGTSTHSSETELLNYQADYILDWHENILDLIEAIKEILTKEKIICSS